MRISPPHSNVARAPRRPSPRVAARTGHVRSRSAAPLGVAEGAAGEKAAFFSQVVPTLKSYGAGGVPGSAAALMYSNVDGKQPYWVDTSVSSLKAFTRMANRPLFLPG